MITQWSSLCGHCDHIIAEGGGGGGSHSFKYAENEDDFMMMS